MLRNKVITCTYPQVITLTDTETDKYGHTHEDEKKTDFTISKRKRRILPFFAKMTDSALFPAVRQKMAGRSIWKMLRLWASRPSGEGLEQREKREHDWQEQPPPSSRASAATVARKATHGQTAGSEWQRRKIRKSTLWDRWRPWWTQVRSIKSAGPTTTVAQTLLRHKSSVRHRMRN